MLKIYIQMILHTILVAPLLLVTLVLCTILLIPSLICNCGDTKKYHKNVFLSIDQVFNAIWGGDAQESISSRSGKRVKTQKWAYYLCRVLHILDPDHCKKSILEDEGEDQILDD